MRARRPSQSLVVDTSQRPTSDTLPLSEAICSRNTLAVHLRKSCLLFLDQLRRLPGCVARLPRCVHSACARQRVRGLEEGEGLTVANARASSEASHAKASSPKRVTGQQETQRAGPASAPQSSGRDPPDPRGQSSSRMLCLIVLALIFISVAAFVVVRPNAVPAERLAKPRLHRTLIPSGGGPKGGIEDAYGEEFDTRDDDEQDGFSQAQAR